MSGKKYLLALRPVIVAIAAVVTCRAREKGALERGLSSHVRPGPYQAMSTAWRGLGEVPDVKKYWAGLKTVDTLPPHLPHPSALLCLERALLPAALEAVGAVGRGQGGQQVSPETTVRVP